MDPKLQAEIDRALTPPVAGICRFCGFDKTRVVTHRWDKESFCVVCQRCWAQGPIAGTAWAAIEDWNKPELYDF